MKRELTAWPGRIPTYQSELHCSLARPMAQLGASDHSIAHALGIGISTFHQWRHRYPEFAGACSLPRAVVNEALKRAAVQRALGYSYEIERVLCRRDGSIVRITATKHVPPSVEMLRWLLKNHCPEEYQDKRKEESPGDAADRVFLKALEDMNAKVLAERFTRANSAADQNAPA